MQLTSLRVQKTRYGRKMFLFWASGSLQIVKPLAFIPDSAIKQLRNQINIVAIINNINKLVLLSYLQL